MRAVCFLRHRAAREIRGWIFKWMSPRVCAQKTSREEQRLSVFEFATRGRHTGVITHRSEPWQGFVTIKQWAVYDGRFLPPPHLSAHKIMLLGDSITCGEAIERVAGEGKHSGWWNGRRSYVYLSSGAHGPSAFNLRGRARFGAQLKR